MKENHPSSVVAISFPIEEDDKWEGSYHQVGHSFRASAHAAANGCVVCGLGKQITWRTRLPHSVVSLVSNEKGSLVVAATDGGTVSFLRGCDGQVLATRNVGGSSTVSFVVSSNAEKDAVIVESSACIILVSQLDGQALNGEDPEAVGRAARSLQINTFQLEIQSVQAYQTSDGAIRMVGVSNDDTISVYETTKDLSGATLVHHGLTLNLGDGQPRKISQGSSLVCHTIRDKIYLVGISDSQDDDRAPYICWWDPVGCQTVCTYHVPTSGSINSIAPLATPDPESLAALAVSFREGHQCKTLVVQLVVEDVLGLVVVSKPHGLFEVAGTRLLTGLPSFPYSSLLETFDSENSPCLQAFLPREEVWKPLSAIKRLMALGDLDKTEELLEEHPQVKWEDLPYSTFHPSEVAICRLKRLMAGSGPIPLEQVQEYLKKLAVGAAAGYTEGLVQAVASVCSMGRPLDVSCTAISGVLSTIDCCLNMGAKDASEMNELKTKLETRLKVTNYLNSQGDSAAHLSSETISSKSIGDLLISLVEENRFCEATALWNSGYCVDIDKETLVASVLAISPEVDPTEYDIFLQDTVIANLLIQDDCIPYLRAWVCGTADALDEQARGLESALHLLGIVDSGLKDLQSRMHQSLAMESPFVAALANSGYTARRVRNANNSMESTAINPDDDTSKALVENPLLPQKANPTILQLGQLSSGAMKLKRESHLFKLGAKVDEDYMELEDCVEDKLREAKCLFRARQIGFPKSKVKLGDFQKKGGALTCAKHLIRVVCVASSSVEECRSSLFETVLPFCRSFDVDFDSALIQASQQLCIGKASTAQNIKDASFIVQSCQSLLMKCRGTLAVLQVALTCSCTEDWLLVLSKQAIGWASTDFSLQSELTEASRLLSIDGIVLRYCGKGAKELFHIDNPRHAIRLLNYVTKQVTRPTVLSDALSLCEAFTHLSPVTACSTILQNILLQDGLGSLLEPVVANLFERNPSMAERVVASSVALVEHILGEAPVSACVNVNVESPVPWQSQSMQASTGIIRILRVARKHTKHLHVECEPSVYGLTVDGSIDKLLEMFSVVRELQRDFNVFLSASELSSSLPRIDVVVSLLGNEIETKMERGWEALAASLKKVKRGVSLIAGGNTKIEHATWEIAAGRVMLAEVDDNGNVEILKLMEVLGLFDVSNTFGDITSWVHLSVALALSSKAAKDGEDTESQAAWIIRGASLVQDRALLAAKDSQLATISKVSSLFDTLVSIFAQMDEGVGERMQKLRRMLTPLRTSTKESKEVLQICSRVPQPTFHKGWYIGDGLLLPPMETLQFAVEFFHDAAGDKLCANTAGHELRRFVAQRGAHFHSLRVCCTSTASLACTMRTPGNKELENVVSDIDEGMSELISCLTERGLGGSGTGITSGFVDSELSVSFLLLMPLKYAFAAYKAALPAAIKTHAFDRVKTLASVGRVASSGGHRDIQNMFSSVAWTNQSKFFQQCDRLVTSSSWWKVLEKHGVQFDPQRLGFAGSDTASGDDGYFKTILSSLMRTASTRLDYSSLIDLCSDYAEAFDIPRHVVLEVHIQLLLTPSETSCSQRGNRSLQTAVQSSLDKLEPTKRCIIVRRCIDEHEKSAAFGTDYERYSTIFDLYYGTLIQALDNKSSTPLNPNISTAELELIDRRRDALAILTSFFQGGRALDRPPFSSFFLPLHESDSSEAEATLEMEHVLHGTAVATKHNPLVSLDFSLRESQETATALAPLCLSLGLRQGYVHARSLVVRFEEATKQRSAYPTLEGDIVPVLNRLRSHADKCALAEWCARQFSSHGDEQLASLDLALESAMIASTEIERQLRSGNKDETLNTLEDAALSRIKRITELKDTLADRQRAKKSMSNMASQSPHGVKQVLTEMTSKLDQAAKEDPTMPPEKLVDMLLAVSSVIIAQGATNATASLSVGQIRQLSAIVSDTCLSVSEQYSHVHPEIRAKRLAEMWLLSGDDVVPGQKSEKDVISKRDDKTPSSDEENTVNFVMDMSDLHDGNAWGGVEVRLAEEKAQVALEEEPSALLPCSPREESEARCIRASIRIAFVMAVAGRLKDQVPSSITASDVNSGPNTAMMKKDILGKIETKRGQKKKESSLLATCKELIQIVFAKSGTNTGILDTTNSFHKDFSFSADHHSKPNFSITFAMRHRALRAVSILCPQEAIHKVLKEETEMCSPEDSLGTGLQSCSFGVFVAKEVEEMGLPLPHSDLLQLSTMNYLSYARSLWRNHRDSDMNGSKGRTLLLLIEMSLKTANTDVDFVTTVLIEMQRRKLSRSLLLAIEQIAKYKNLTENALLETQTLESSILFVVETMVAEYNNSTKVDCHNVAQTISRVEKLLKSLKPFDVGTKGLVMLSPLLQGASVT